MTSSDYETLYAKAAIVAKHQLEVEYRARQIKSNELTYLRVENQTGIPWWCVGAIHSLESQLNFHCHLHNGDPLTDRTVHVPRGRPVAMPLSGHFPYEWYESATDALTGRWQPATWSRGSCLEFLERYNGTGYQAKGVNTPYLWSMTTAYTAGLFVFDGQFSANNVSANIGAAALLKVLEANALVKFGEAE